MAQTSAPIYLIGGVPRSGKSILARKLYDNKHIPFLSTDILRFMLEKRLTDDYFQVTDKPFESHDTTRSKYVYPYLESFIKTLLRFSETGFTLEGVNLTPKLLSIFADNRHVRSLYLGFADANLSEKYQSLKNHQSTHDWTSEYTDAELKGLVRRKIIKSSRMRRECRKYGIKYLDTGIDFESSIEDAYRYLISRATTEIVS